MIWNLYLTENQFLKGCVSNSLSGRKKKQAEGIQENVFGNQSRDNGSSHRGEETHFVGRKNQVQEGNVVLVLLGAGADATGSEGGVCLYGAQEDEVGASQPYLARSLLVGGGVREGEAENSPGCSGMGASMGGA